MGRKDPRIDAYIAQSAAFAKPILRHIRKLVHTACPQVEEDVKWTFPHFLYKGILCSMAAFKQHCAFGFWHADVRRRIEPHGVAERAMGQLGRMTSVADLPPDAKILAAVGEAVRLNESDVKSPRPKRVKKPVKVPSYFLAALKKNKKALAAFEEFPPSHKREYIEWITEAKREETREKRLATALEWIAKGKSRNWKYENCQTPITDFKLLF